MYEEVLHDITIEKLKQRNIDYFVDTITKLMSPP